MASSRFVMAKASKQVGLMGGDSELLGARLPASRGDQAQRLRGVAFVQRRRQPRGSLVPIFQRGPERRLQRAKPLLVRPPLVEAFAIDRAADLLGADGPDRPLVGMEFEQASSNGRPR